jgi:hypothetical protein
VEFRTDLTIVFDWLELERKLYTVVCLPVTVLDWLHGQQLHLKPDGSVPSRVRALAVAGLYPSKQLGHTKAMGSKLSGNKMNLSNEKEGQEHSRVEIGPTKVAKVRVSERSAQVPRSGGRPRKYPNAPDTVSLILGVCSC